MPARPTLPRLHDRSTLGSSGLQVSPVCLARVAQPETIPAAFDCGINFFYLSADMHWPLYEGTRRGLEMLLSRGAGIRDQIVVVTACHAMQLELCHAPFQEVVQFTPGLQRIDVLLAGAAYGFEIERRLALFQRHRSAGFVGARAVAAGFAELPVAAQYVAAGGGDLWMVRYDPQYPFAEEALFPRGAQRTSPLFVLPHPASLPSPQQCDALGLDPALWRPDWTDCYRYALTPNSVDGVLLNVGSAADIHALDRALARGPLSDDECAYLRSLSLLHEGLAEVVADSDT